MDELDEALAQFWKAASESSIRRVAARVPVPYSTAAGWKRGQRPSGENRESLLIWARAQRSEAPQAKSSAGDGSDARASQLPFDSTIADWSEMIGYMTAIRDMMRTVTDAQTTLIDRAIGFAQNRPYADHSQSDDLGQQIRKHLVQSAQTVSPTQDRKVE